MKVLDSVQVVTMTKAILTVKQSTKRKKQNTMIASHTSVGDGVGLSVGDGVGFEVGDGVGFEVGAGVG